MAMQEDRPSNISYYREMTSVMARQRLRSSLRGNGGESNPSLRILRIGRKPTDETEPSDAPVHAVPPITVFEEKAE